MRTRISSVAALMAFCGLAMAPAATALPTTSISTVAQMAQFNQDQARNAALDYWRLVNVTPQIDEIADAVRSTLREMHSDGEDERPIERPAALMPGGALGESLANLEGFFDDLERATREPNCDFQVRYEDGYAALLPHLQHMRMLGRLLMVDARRLALRGDHEGAAERLASTFRLARHTSGDEVLVSSLVSSAISRVAMNEAEWLLDRTGGDRAVREPLRQALDRFPARDPFQVAVALRRERDLIASLARQFRGPNAGEEFADVFLQMTEGEYGEAERRIRSLDGKAFRADVERAVDAFDLVFEAWDSDTPIADLDALGERLVAEEFGSIALIVVPAVGRTYASDAESRAALEALRRRVKNDG